MPAELVGSSILAFVFTAIFGVFAVIAWVAVGRDGFGAHRGLAALAFTFMTLGPLATGLLVLAGVKILPMLLGGFLWGSGFVLSLVAIRVKRRGG